MEKKKILISVGTRPNFVKISRFRELIDDFPNLELKIVHTGQHYSKELSQTFFDELEIQPDIVFQHTNKSNLSIFASIIQQLDEYIDTHFYPDMIIVPGDVNATLATAIVANKKDIKLAHLESGLRSNDRTMPEEINRILTDEISDIFFVTEKSGIENLIGKENVHFVGNTMIDSLVKFKDKIQNTHLPFQLPKQDYCVITMHRPSNVDEIDKLVNLISLIKEIAQNINVIFPIHPRTEKKLSQLESFKSLKENAAITICPPLSYLKFQKIIAGSSVVITDSGGLQEETTYLRIPCITIRDNTERPITINEGTNQLLAFDKQEILNCIKKILNTNYSKYAIPKFWDGNSTRRILEIINANKF